MKIRKTSTQISFEKSVPMIHKMDKELPKPVMVLRKSPNKSILLWYSISRENIVPWEDKTRYSPIFAIFC